MSPREQSIAQRLEGVRTDVKADSNSNDHGGSDSDSNAKRLTSHTYKTVTLESADDNHVIERSIVDGQVQEDEINDIEDDDDDDYTDDDGGDDDDEVSLDDGAAIAAFIPDHLRPYVLPYHGDFCYSFYPSSHYLIVQLMAEGFLPMAASNDVLLPKLHRERSVIKLKPTATDSGDSDLHVRKSVRKKSKQFHMTFNQAFDDVVTQCRKQHGLKRCWLYPSLVEAYRAILQAKCLLLNDKIPIRFYSVELWNKDDQLVAGELGYTVGSIYTSLTGFSNQDSAGSVQLVALGRWLESKQFTHWDLGMDMEYKRELGSKLIARDDFVATVKSFRERDLQLYPKGQEGSMNAKDIIDGTQSIQKMTTETIPPKKQPKQKKKCGVKAFKEHQPPFSNDGSPVDKKKPRSGSTTKVI